MKLKIVKNRDLNQTLRLRVDKTGKLFLNKKIKQLFNIKACDKILVSINVDETSSDIFYLKKDNKSTFSFPVKGKEVLYLSLKYLLRDNDILFSDGKCRFAMNMNLIEFENSYYCQIYKL